MKSFIDIIKYFSYNQFNFLSSFEMKLEISFALIILLEHFSYQNMNIYGCFINKIVDFISYYFKFNYNLIFLVGQIYFGLIFLCIGKFTVIFNLKHVVQWSPIHPCSSGIYNVLRSFRWLAIGKIGFTLHCGKIEPSWVIQYHNLCTYRSHIWKKQVTWIDS